MLNELVYSLHYILFNICFIFIIICKYILINLYLFNFEVYIIYMNYRSIFYICVTSLSIWYGERERQKINIFLKMIYRMQLYSIKNKW